ncbi:pyridoxamine 5'-phosphate oxidase [Legionella nagasakiensis]|uniref:pyridoxamine 5'-phosphate oxidase n=1 Tax=Legionella nagasakiensis TaxID=535290 RepID=UPI001054A2C4|nr:pyridoxamine 5'-phosphate oxidase [Legionella nagasakiensis]
MNKSKWKTISDIRREYGQLNLSEETIPDNPIELFEEWFTEVLQSEKSDPTAMVLSTADERGFPDSRVVLLKGIEDSTFIFYTNYQSAKAMQIAKNPYAALNFYWPQTARQVRIRGRVKRTTTVQSDMYFASRPKASQFSAIVSPQSQEVTGRAELEQRLNDLIVNHQQETVVRPEHWGGYIIIPDEIEFWQGRDSRLHDRIHYYRKEGEWVHRRLAP